MGMGRGTVQKLEGGGVQVLEGRVEPEGRLALLAVHVDGENGDNGDTEDRSIRQ
jgi:hypothetical protein